MPPRTTESFDAGSVARRLAIILTGLSSLESLQSTNQQGHLSSAKVTCVHVGRTQLFVGRRKLPRLSPTWGYLTTPTAFGVTNTGKFDGGGFNFSLANEGFILAVFSDTLFDTYLRRLYWKLIRI